MKAIFTNAIARFRNFICKDIRTEMLQGLDEIENETCSAIRDLEKEVCEIDNNEHSISELEDRVDELNERLMPLERIDFESVLDNHEDRIDELENEVRELKRLLIASGVIKDCPECGDRDCPP